MMDCYKISYEALKEEVMMHSLSTMLQINLDILQLKFSKELVITSKDSTIMIQPVWLEDMVNTINTVITVKILSEESYQDTKIWLVKSYVTEEESMTQF
jgi:hypothetical protein